MQEVSADELAGLDFDIEDGAAEVDTNLAVGALAEGAVAEAEAEDEALDIVEDLGFEEDAGPVQTEDAYAVDAYEVVAEPEQAEAAPAQEAALDDAFGEPAPAVDEAGWYAAASPAAEAGDEEEEEEEEEGERDEEVDDGADDIMFFEDTTATASVAKEAATPKVAVFEEEPEAVVGDAEQMVSAVICTNCGLPGHDTTACPFGHPEDIQLGDMEESDSDDELPQAHPLLARYVSQHTGALVPKVKKGLTGEKRYFGEDKPYRQCWVCGSEQHESNDCTLKRCFFCGEPGHDSRVCSEKAKICSHCRCKGHLPMACPTIASQELVSFANTHCLRCGELGHANCGKPPLAAPMPGQIPLGAQMPSQMPAQLQRPPPPPPGGFMAPSRPEMPMSQIDMFRKGIGKGPGKQPQMNMFNMGLPPSTPASPPPSPGWGPPGDNFTLVRPRTPTPQSLWSGAESKAVQINTSKAASMPGAESKAASPTAPTNGRAAMNLPPPSNARAPMNLPPPTKSSAPTSLPPPPSNGKAINLPPRAPVPNGSYRPTAVKSAGKSAGNAMTPQNMQVNDPLPRSKSGSMEMGGEAPISKSSSAPGKAPISKVPGKAPITKVAGKAPISKVPGKAPITKVPPSGSTQPTTLLKTSAKRPSTGGAPPPKKAKSQGKGKW